MHITTTVINPQISFDGVSVGRNYDCRDHSIPVTIRSWGENVCVCQHVC